MIIKKDLGNNSFFIGESIETGENFSIGSNNELRALNFHCGDNVTIGSNNKFLIGDSISLGDCSYIGSNNDITSLKANFGSYLYLDSNVIIGHGGKMNYDSEIYIDSRCMICAYVKLNVNYKIEIGKNVGIGENVDIWTHGAYPAVLDGFPAQFGRVKIGNNVWIPAKSTIMPNVIIGDNVVIGANSVINKNLPSGSLCAGIPVKVIRENIYPKILSVDEKLQIIRNALSEYSKLQKFKDINLSYELNERQLQITTMSCVFDFNTMTIKGCLELEEEDLRDFLRRRGIKFFTGKPFKSIIPNVYKDLINYEK